MISQTMPRNDSSPDAANGISIPLTACAPGAENPRGRNAGENRSDRLYEFFINRLRHPYELCPMLTVLMVKPHASHAQRIRLLAWPEWGCLDGSTPVPHAAQ